MRRRGRAGQHARRHDLLLDRDAGQDRMDHPAGCLDAPTGPGAEIPLGTRGADGLLRLPAHHRRGHRHRAGTDAQQRVADRRRDARGQDPALHCRTGDLPGRPIPFLI